MRSTAAMSTLVASVALAVSAAPAQAREPGPYDVTQVDAKQPLPPGVKAKGKTVEQVWTWTDGDFATAMAAVFSSTDTMAKDGRLVARKIFVQLYRGKPGKLKQVRLVQDAVAPCEFDVTADFVPGSVTVTDEDGDELAELAFAYDLACRSDVSPATRKLLVLENKAKHALRGTNRVQVGEREFAGGEFKADGFKKDEAGRKMAEARWQVLLGATAPAP